MRHGRCDSQCVRDDVREASSEDASSRWRSRAGQGVRVECPVDGRWVRLLLAEHWLRTVQLSSIQLAGRLGSGCVGRRYEPHKGDTTWPGRAMDASNSLHRGQDCQLPSIDSSFSKAFASGRTSAAATTLSRVGSTQGMVRFLERECSADDASDGLRASSSDSDQV